jgi:hypothetical protein
MQHPKRNRCAQWLRAAAAATCLFQTAHANSQSCNLNGKQVIYQLQLCENRACQSGIEMFRVLGRKVLSYRGPSGSKGREFNLGQSIRIDPDPFLPPGGANVHMSTTLTASYENNVMRLIEDTASIAPNAPDGRILGVLVIEILPGCTLCRLQEASLVASLLDGTPAGQKRFTATSCYVSDIPRE